MPTFAFPKCNVFCRWALKSGNGFKEGRDGRVVDCGGLENR